MDIELYINYTRIEMEDIPFSYTKQWNDFKDISDRQGSFSNKFIAPLTPKNIDTFGMLGIVGNQSRTPYISNEVLLIVDSVPIVSNGHAHITGINNKGFEIIIYDDNIQFFQELGDKKLSDLDLSVLDHDLTKTNFTDSFSHTYTDGYIYAIADFGNFDTAPIILNYQLPSFFVRYIWDLIHDEIGYTSDFDPDNDHIFTPKRGYNSEVDTGTASSITVTESGTYLDNNNSLSQFTVDIFQEFSDNSNGVITSVDGIITVTESGVYHFDNAINLTGDTWDYLDNARYIIKVNGVIVSNEIFAHIDSPLPTNPITYDMDLVLTKNDTVKIYYRLTYYNDYVMDVIENAYLQWNSSMDFYNVAGATGITVKMSLFIGEMTQTQFIKDIMQMYALTSYKAKDAKEMNYKKASVLLADTSNADDWSDRNVEILSEIFTLNNYSQKNRFAYSYQNPDEAPYADGIMQISNYTLSSQEKNALTRPYNAPRVGETLLDSEFTWFAPFWEAQRDSDGTITGWKSITGKNYFAEVVIRNSTSITYKTEADLSSTTATYNIAVLAFSSLDYQSLLNTNYTEINEMLDWNRILSVKLTMDLFDFDNIDPFKLKYIKQLGGYFFLNKIKYGKTVIANLIFAPITSSTKK